MELLLNRQELLDLGGKRQGLNITCREGRCWVTQSGDSRDHILGVGDRFTATTNGQLVITATEPCRLMLHELEGKKQSSWFARFFAGTNWIDRSGHGCKLWAVRL